MIRGSIAVFAVIALLVTTMAVLASTPKDSTKKAPDEPVNWQAMGACLPEKVEGMKVSELDGQMLEMANPMNPSEKFFYSVAERTYTFQKDKDKEITLGVQDTHYNQMLLAPFTMAMTYDSPEGGIKTIEINEQPAKVFLEKDDGKITDIRCMMLVGERLLLGAEADGNVTEEEITDLMTKVDFKGLVKLVK